MTQDAHLKIVRKTGSSTNTKQHGVWCEYIHTVVNGRQLIIYHTACARRERRDQCIVARNGKLPWSTKAIVCTVREFEHHDVVRCMIFPDESLEKYPRAWTKQASITLEEATGAYMVEVQAMSQFLKQQLISWRCSTCLLPWQGQEVVYSWNSPTCTWPWTWPKWPKKGFHAPR